MQGAFPGGPVWASCAETVVVETVFLSSSLRWRGSYHPGQCSMGHMWRTAAAEREIIPPSFYASRNKSMCNLILYPFISRIKELYFLRQLYRKGKREPGGGGLLKWQRSLVARLSMIVRAGGRSVVVAQWKSTASSSQVSWVQFPVTAYWLVNLVSSCFSSKRGH